jgi:uncharacterized protein
VPEVIMTTPDTPALSSPASLDIPAISPPSFASASYEEQNVVAPVRLDERIQALDTIRGFALLGILLMNITAFGLPSAAYDNPLPAGGATGWNLITWCFITVVADGKMRAIFSLTFGASVYLLIDRLVRKGAAAEAADIHYRRMLWLMLFGLIHAYFIWLGDILYFYGMLGLLLYPLRKLSARVLLTAAGILMLAMTGVGVYYYVHIQNLHHEYSQIQVDEKAGKKLTLDQESAKKEWDETVSEINPSAEELKKETDAHLGSYFKLFLFRAQKVYHAHSTPIYMHMDILTMMLFGMGMMKLGLLTGKYSTRFYVWMALISFAIGLPSHTWLVWWCAKEHFSIESWYLTGIVYEIGRFTAFGYIAVLLILVRSGVLRFVTGTLAYVGRMAFSNYILTSLLCTTLFEGYGFGLFGKLQRYQLYAVVLCVWAVILIVSPIWLRHFRFGPLEWGWRSLTYWKKQPFRIPAPQV